MGSVTRRLRKNIARNAAPVPRVAGAAVTGRNPLANADVKTSRARMPFHAMAVVVSTLLLAAFMFSNKLKAEETKSENQNPETGLTVSATGGAYDRGNKPFVGAGLSLNVNYKHVRFNGGIHGIFGNFGGAELDSVELNITIPAGPVAFTPFIYHSQYYGGVPLGAGMAFHIPKLNLHTGPHWCKGNNAVPVPVFWTPSIERLGLMFKVIPVVNHGAMAKPAPILGGEFKVSVKLAENASIYGKGWMMSVRDENGTMFVGPINSQAGVELSF